MEGLARTGAVSDLRKTLDRYHHQLERTACGTTIDEMIRDLGALYDAAARSDALPEFRETCQRHPLHQLTLQDPFTQRAFSKPRGYAGDAVMLDYIYRPSTLELTAIGAAIHQMTTGVSAAKSITWRRDHLGDEISKTVSRAHRARVLSVASGHLRELDIVRNVVRHRDFEIVALDQDRASLEEAVNSNPDFNIAPVNKSISHLLKGQDHTKYDLIYSAGLLDYLSNKTAADLLVRLVDMLTPAGRLIVGNYAPENYGRGYMEGMMGWTLLYRNEAGMDALLNVPNKRKVYRDEPGNVAYLQISSDLN